MLGSDSKGGSLLDEFSRIREQLTGAKSVGREIQADLARTATLLGKFAVRSLDSRTRPVSEEALALQQAIASPRALLMGTEAAALELFTGTKQRAVVRSSRQNSEGGAGVSGGGGRTSRPTSLRSTSGQLLLRRPP